MNLFLECKRNLKSYFEFVLLITSAGLCSSTTNYCDRSLCGRGQHIGCNATKGFAPACGKNAEYVPMDGKMKEIILNKHNTLRAKMAQGFSGFPPAQRMPTLVWDDELATVASFNARRCKFQHDNCRNTKEFKYSGQNLAMARFSGKTVKPDERAAFFLQKWFDEHRHCPKSIIAKFPFSYKGPQIGHFTLMMNDRVWKVGCSMVRYKSGKWTNLFFVCNYSMNNILGRPVYAGGKTASKCKTGQNAKFKGLCSTKENGV
uniref:Venom allergen-1 n=1 Tax=Aedes albopictus TaxID=7160 RepID=A0A023ELJ5_AEDAL